MFKGVSMHRFWSLIGLLIFSLAINSVIAAESDNTDNSPKRIISLAPSITEMLFALDLGPSIIAVSDYCDYPHQVKKLPKVGSYLNANLEYIIALQPDLVILSHNQHNTIQQLKQLNIKTLEIRSDSIADIKDSLALIGQTTHHVSQATALITNMEVTQHRITQKISSATTQPSVMVTIGHSMEQQNLTTIYISGQHDVYNELITLAGGINVYQHDTLRVPSLSLEGIIQLNPDIIIDVFPEPDDHQYNLTQVKDTWMDIDFITAVKSEKVHIIEADYATIPGPRILLLLELFARLIHPELNWDPAS
jgi:iron complex transport system substrate-binding protein